MTRCCYSDTETYCETPIKAGTPRYSEDVEVMLWFYAFDDGPVKLWNIVEGEPMPDDLRAAVEDEDVTFVFHKSDFDRACIKSALGIDIPVERTHDTMVQALAHGLPGGLGVLGEIFGIPQDEAKDKAGKQLIQLFCKPQPKNRKYRRATYVTHPLEWAKFISYGGSDITAMRAIHKRLPTWNYRDGELALWHLDQRSNTRGFTGDTELARAAVRAIERAQSALAKATQKATDGEVESATKRDQLLKYILESYGVDLPDMRADTLERRLEDPELPEGVKELIRIRLQACTSSTAKFKSFLEAVSSDGKLRGTIQFCGASRTGRDAGRKFQAQNLPRPSMKSHDIELGIEALKNDCADVIFSNVMELCSNAIRGLIVASPGKKLVVADLSNIEGRGAAWLAGEDWKLQAFRDYDTCMGKDGNWHTAEEIYSAARLGNYIELETDKKGEPIRMGHDLYALAYANSFNITPEEVMENKKSGDGLMRQIGKVMELFLQYEGGVGAFLTGAATYRIDLDKLARIAMPNIPEEILEACIRFWEFSVKNRRTFGLERNVFVVCDGLKRMWRNAHPAISSYWPEINSAAIHAVLNPGVTWPCRKLKFRRDGAWLRMVLPSSRALCYVSPRIENEKLKYKGVSAYTKRWGNQSTYGGKLFENATQALARDVFKGTDMREGANLPSTHHRIEEEGYNILLPVHDEAVTEAPDTPEYNAERLAALMVDAPSWAEGLPLAAAGFETKRYRKD